MPVLTHVVLTKQRHQGMLLYYDSGICGKVLAVATYRTPIQEEKYMSIPKLLTVEQVAEALDLSIATLDRYRANGTGPNFLRVGDGGNIRYLESDVVAYLESCRALPPIDGSKASTPAQLQAALTAGNAEVKAARAQRNADMVALDKSDHDLHQRGSNDGGVTMGFAGSQPGIERHFNVPPQSFSNEPPPHIIQGR